MVLDAGQYQAEGRVQLPGVVDVDDRELGRRDLVAFGIADLAEPLEHGRRVAGSGAAVHEHRARSHSVRPDAPPSGALSAVTIRFVPAMVVTSRPPGLSAASQLAGMGRTATVAMIRS